MRVPDQRRMAVWVWLTIPVLLQFLIVMEYRTDLIILDEFRHILPRVQHLLDGGFSIYADVWANQNAHRPVIPILFILANAYFAGWQVVYETALAFAAYVAVLVVLVRQHLRTSRTLGFERADWALPVASFLLFSITSWKVFYMGYAALQHSLAILGSVAGIVVLSRPSRPPWRGLFHAALLGLVGTLSFAPALVFWPVGFFVLLCRRTSRQRTRFCQLGLWLLITLVVTGSYLYDMHGSTGPTHFPGRLVERAEFTLVYLGAPICNYNLTGALLAGIAGVLGLALLALDLLLRRKIALADLAAYLALGLFSIGAGALTSLGRLLYGADSVLQRDWKIFATPLWIAIVFLIDLWFESAAPGQSARHDTDASRHAASPASDAGPRSVGRRIGGRIDPWISGVLSAAMATAMLSFWSTNFAELELYESRHIPLARLSAQLTGRPIPSDSSIPSFRHELSRSAKQSAQRAAEKARQLSHESVTFKQLRALHPKEDAAGISWRLDFLRRHALSVFRVPREPDPSPASTLQSSTPTRNSTTTTRGAERMPDVILISIDTLRRDHLPIYGYSRNTSPNLLGLAQRSVIFESALTTHTNTAPAHASMLTGRYPGSHGVLDNWIGLRDDVTTLAEVLREHGYRSGAFVSGLPLSTHTNLQRGFDVYDSPIAPQRQRPAARTWANATRWIEGAATAANPFFLFLHFYDPHSPYNPPAGLGKKFGQRRRFKKGSVRHLRDRYTGPGSSRLVEDNISRYDGEIFYADRHVGKLLQRLDRLGRMADALILFTSDHGETLFERDWVFDHGCRVFDEQLRVPLLIRFPGDRFAGTRIEAQVSHVDLMSTILDLLGVTPPVPGQGRSLMPLVETRSDLSLERATPEFGLARLCKNRLGPLATRIGEGRLLAAARTHDFKLIEYPGLDGRPLVQLFDLNADPAEQRDVILERPEVARTLAAALAKWQRETELPSADVSPELSPELQEGLRALGYAR